jgi:hypothetical protein
MKQSLPGKAMIAMMCSCAMEERLSTDKKRGEGKEE